jgi:hypothetical protein
MNCFLCELFYCKALSLPVYICCYTYHPNLCHRFGRNHPHQLDPWWKVFIGSLLPLFGRMHNYCLLLLIWFIFMVPEHSSCDLCIHTTQAGSVVTRTLLFHTHYSCADTVIRSCTHNHTTYLMCSHVNQHICFNLTYCPQEKWLEIWTSTTLGTLSAGPRCLVLINQCQ